VVRIDRDGPCPKTMDKLDQLPSTVMQDTEGLRNMEEHHVAPHSHIVSENKRKSLEVIF
jgi:hypothetical protein